MYCAQQVLRRLGAERLRVGVIASENHMVFQPMLPEVVGGSLSPQHVVNPIRMICDGADVLKAQVTDLDLTNRVMTLDGGRFTPAVKVRSAASCTAATIVAPTLPLAPKTPTRMDAA